MDKNHRPKNLRRPSHEEGAGCPQERRRLRPDVDKRFNSQMFTDGSQAGDSAAMAPSGERRA